MMRAYSDDNYELYRAQSRYVYGSAARAFNPEEPMTRAQYEEEAEEKRRRSEIRHKKSILRSNRVYTFYLVFAVAFTGILMARYIELQSSITIKLREIASLETKVEDLKADNDAIEKRLATTVPVISVKEQALTRLGMSYARESQIRYYSVDNVDYMSQFEEIP